MKIAGGSHLESFHDKQMGTFTNMSIVAEAKRANCWLYNKLTNTWYTPEEFYAKYANHRDTNINIRTVLENISIRDPQSGIKAYHKALAEKLMQMEVETRLLRERGESFSQKVIDYYQAKTKSK
ncbi:hypothetical protein ACJVDH_00470 [Pedobacter sp. AW1-32]|uniref:hypothetical protein n=1 Tax=Pedobacter sp. AW1-32 TaxID=3383026 RepID=UPI003FEEE741